MARYRKLPVMIEAWQIGSDEPIPDWLERAIFSGIAEECYDSGRINEIVYRNDGTINPTDKARYWVIKTLEGNHLARHGDFIIQGIHGELYPCKPDIFEKTYERVD